jgi:hypothetical protein
MPDTENLLEAFVEKIAKLSTTDEAGDPEETPFELAALLDSFIVEARTLIEEG